MCLTPRAGQPTAGLVDAGLGRVVAPGSRRARQCSFSISSCKGVNGGAGHWTKDQDETCTGWVAGSGRPLVGLMESGPGCAPGLGSSLARRRSIPGLVVTYVKVSSGVLVPGTST